MNGNMNKMTVSEEGRQFIKQFEELRLEAYKCPAGVLTIGWGHTGGVKTGQHISTDRAESLLTEDLAPIERLLNGQSVRFTQQQFDALASWIFNNGTDNFVRSTLCKRIMDGADAEAVTAQMVRWYYAKSGRPLLGLKKRRIAEANMYLGYRRYILRTGNIVKV